MNTLQDIKKAVVRSQHCQRNFDLSRKIPEDDLELLVYAATNCPSKQNIKFYNLHVITNKDVISKVHELSPGVDAIDKNTNEIVHTTNSQVLANAIFVFEALPWGKMTPHYYKKLSFGEDYDCFERDLNTAIGIAAGYVNLTASMLFYSTGCCQCFNVEAIKSYLKLDQKPKLIMGLGFKSPNLNRRVHPVDKNLIFPTRKKEEILVNYIR